MIERKPDAGRIEARLDTLKSANWLGPARQWWPNFVFFFADLHDGWMREEEKGEIKFHRHAEVIVPHELDLEGLRRIWCRSEAEYQTLLHAKWSDYPNAYRVGKYEQDRIVITAAAGTFPLSERQA